MSKTVRVRNFPDRNYFATFTDRGKTHRFTHTPGPIQALEYPEIEDISISSKCFAGCSFCYTSAVKTGTNHKDVVQKILDYYGNLPLESRPFQIAIGGEGEPTLHPDFPQILETFRSLDIMPNYTTNGMHLTDTVLEATVKWAGGVAVSCHPHLNRYWKPAVTKYLAAGVYTCVHIIVGEPDTNQRFWEILEEFPGLNYYVALPYMAAGRGKPVDVEPEWHAFFEELIKRGTKNVAFGALFYPFFEKHPEIPRAAGIELYEPEVLSGYRIMDDSYKLLRKSSYDLSPKFELLTTV